MRRGHHLLPRLLLGLAAVAVVAVGGARLPEALARVEAFHVDRFELRGARYLDLEDAVRAAAVPDGASVWDDPAEWEDGLRLHPLVREARVRRKLPATLVLHVEEEEPVALLPTPVLEPVDSEGRILPIDPALHRLDLPVLQAKRGGGRAAPALTPEQVRFLAGEVGRIGLEEPQFLTRVSDVALDDLGTMVARLDDPPVTVHFRPPLTPRRLREAMVVLEDALDRRPGQRPEAIDLRFADQVVVRFAGRGR